MPNETALEEQATHELCRHEVNIVDTTEEEVNEIVNCTGSYLQLTKETKEGRQYLFGLENHAATEIFVSNSTGRWYALHPFPFKTVIKAWRLSKQLGLPLSEIPFDPGKELKYLEHIQLISEWFREQVVRLAQESDSLDLSSGSIRLEIDDGKGSSSLVTRQIRKFLRSKGKKL